MDREHTLTAARKRQIRNRSVRVKYKDVAILLSILEEVDLDEVEGRTRDRLKAMAERLESAQ